MTVILDASRPADLGGRAVHVTYDGPVQEAPVRVLVVDDDPDLRELLRLRFEMAGFGVRGAANGLEALEVARHYPVSVAVMDLGMPVMSGEEAIPRLREIDPDVRIVVHTAHDDLTRLTGDARVDAVFRKGVPLTDIIQTVQSFGSAAPRGEQVITLSEIPLQEGVDAFDTWVGVNVRIRETVDESAAASQRGPVATADIAALTNIFIDLGAQLAAAAQRHADRVTLRASVDPTNAASALRALERIRSIGLETFYAGWSYQPSPHAAAAVARMADLLSDALRQS